MSQRGTAVITGGEGDLAGEIARCLRDSGYRVLAPGREELDVQNEASVQAWFAECDQVDFLINNAGCMDDAPALWLRAEQWDRVLQTNVRGSFLCSRAVLRGMLRRRSGHILHIGSYSARSGPAGQSAYAASKAALIGLTQSLAREGGSRNVRSNVVLPGFLDTKFTAEVSLDVREKHLSHHVLGRFNTVQDAARFIVMLDSFESVSGQVFQLDSRVSNWT